MSSLEERVALLEGRVHDQAAFIAIMQSTGTELRAEMAALRATIADVRTELRADIAALRTELRADIEALRTELRAEIEALRAELRAEIAAVRTELRAEFRSEIDGLRAEMDRRFDRADRQFGWLVGIVVTSFVATIGTVAGAFWTLLQAVR